MICRALARRLTYNRVDKVLAFKDVPAQWGSKQVSRHQLGLCDLGREINLVLGRRDKHRMRWDGREGASGGGNSIFQF